MSLHPTLGTGLLFAGRKRRIDLIEVAIQDPEAMRGRRDGTAIGRGEEVRTQWLVTDSMPSLAVSQLLMLRATRQCS